MAGNRVAMGQHKRLAPSKTLEQQTLARFGQRFGYICRLSTDFGRISPKDSACFSTGNASYIYSWQGLMALRSNGMTNLLCVAMEGPGNTGNSANQGPLRLDASSSTGGKHIPSNPVLLGTAHGSWFKSKVSTT